jgi:hypothetical protein
MAGLPYGRVRGADVNGSRSICHWQNQALLIVMRAAYFEELEAIGLQTIGDAFCSAFAAQGCWDGVSPLQECLLRFFFYDVTERFDCEASRFDPQTAGLCLAVGADCNLRKQENGVSFGIG